MDMVYCFFNKVIHSAIRLYLSYLLSLSASGSEGVGNHHRMAMAMEEEVMFRLLCQVDKVGSLIGKGGSIRRALQTETGATIKIADSAPQSDERVVVISAREACELATS